MESRLDELKNLVFRWRFREICACKSSKGNPGSLDRTFCRDFEGLKRSKLELLSEINSNNSSAYVSSPRFQLWSFFSVIPLAQAVIKTSRRTCFRQVTPNESPQPAEVAEQNTTSPTAKTATVLACTWVRRHARLGRRYAVVASMHSPPQPARSLGSALHFFCCLKSAGGRAARMNQTVG